MEVVEELRKINGSKKYKVRFYGITRMYENNVDEESIRYTAGHTTLEMTRHYDKSHSKRKMVSREIMATL